MTDPSASTEYQLVFQLPGSSQVDFEDLTRLERELRSEVGNLGTVDGHDMGLGEMNIFVLTRSPIQFFERALTLTGIRRAMPRMKVAFREVEGEDYEILYPPGLYEFEVK